MSEKDVLLKTGLMSTGALFEQQELPIFLCSCLVEDELGNDIVVHAK